MNYKEKFKRAEQSIEAIKNLAWDYTSGIAMDFGAEDVKKIERHTGHKIPESMMLLERE